MKLTARQKDTLRQIADGEWLSLAHLAPIHELQKKGLIEEIKTSFLSQVSLRITPAGRLALDQDRQDGRGR